MVLSLLLQAKVSYVGGVVSPTTGKSKLCWRSSILLQAKVSYVLGVVSPTAGEGKLCFRRQRKALLDGYLS